MSASPSSPSAPARALKPETLAQAPAIVAQYPQKRSATMPLLHLVQEDRGHITADDMHWVAEQVGVTPMQVLEVVTFYPMFRQQPIGRRHIKVCRTLSCALRGAYQTCATFEREFNTHRGEVSPDGEVPVEFVECLASCGTAPVVMIDDDLHENVDGAAARRLSDRIKAEAAARR